MRVSCLSLGSVDGCFALMPLLRAWSLLVLLLSTLLAEAADCSVGSAAGELLRVFPPENAAAEGGPRCTVAAFRAALSAAARRDASSASSWLLARSYGAGGLSGSHAGCDRSSLTIERDETSDCLAVARPRHE